MKYVTWTVRLWYAAWMIPMGLEHFYHIFPQPGYFSPIPLQHETLFAFLHSHLFDAVKAVELLTGIAVLFDFYAPLMLLVCMTVVFNVFWWDAPLSHYHTGSVIAGGKVLISNILLSIAFFSCYRAMFTLRAKPLPLGAEGTANAAAGPGVQQLVLAGRIIFGAWMLLSGANYLFFGLWTMPMGHEPVATELMGSFVHSGLMNVAMLIQLITGAFILAGVFTPAALCVVMPTSLCALFWALLEHEPTSLLLAVTAFALNGLLMLAYFGYYRAALQRRVLTLGESEQAPSFASLYVFAQGRTSRKHFTVALIPLAIAALDYTHSGPGPYNAWMVLVLLYPAVVLFARRLHDMGHSGWPLIVPAGLTIAAMAIWDHRLDFGTQLNFAVPMVALAVFVGFIVWGCIDRGNSGTAAALA
jgi:uncharacterized membrane protein YhaH (DUF805 family)